MSSITTSFIIVTNTLEFCQAKSSAAAGLSDILGGI
jgi:hypothetical protein